MNAGGDREVRVMAHRMGQGELRQAAFRSRATGRVISTGCFHDIGCLPGGIEADLDQWTAGFTDVSGRFLDRAEAAAVAGHAGRLEARAFFADEPDPTLEAGRQESWSALGVA
jgi:hypothetical protein